MRDVLTSSFYGLLLLPPPPNKASPPVIRAAFKPPIEAVLKRIAQHTDSSEGTAVLELALPYPNVIHSAVDHADHRIIFFDVQRLLTSMYSLLGTTLEHFKKRVDVRIILIDYQRNYDYGHLDRQEPDGHLSTISSVVRFSTLASSRRPWTHIFAVEGEQGERLFQQFLTLSHELPYKGTNNKWKTERVRGGLVLQRQTAGASAVEETMEDHAAVPRYAHVVICGVQRLDFDTKIRLSMAAFLALYQPYSHSSQPKSKFHVGLDANWRNGKENSDVHSVTDMTDLKAQQAAITEFLLAVSVFSPLSMTDEFEQQSPSGTTTTIVELSSNCVIEFYTDLSPEDMAFGPESVAAILVSSGLCDGSIKMNKARRTKGLTEIAIFEVFEYTADELDTDEDIDRARTRKTIC